MIRNYTVNYTEALDRITDLGSLYSEYFKMLSWLKTNLELNKDYEWSNPITIFLHNRKVRMTNMSLYLYFNKDDDRLAFKLMFSV